MHKKYLLFIPMLLTGSILYAQNKRKTVPADTAAKKNDTTQLKKHDLNEVVVSASRIRKYAEIAGKYRKNNGSRF
jgi:predicted nucleic acid-binding protein